MLHHGHHHGHLMFFSVIGFFLAVAVAAVVMYRPAFPISYTSTTQAENANITMVSDTDVINNLNSKITSLERMVTSLSSKLDAQVSSLQAVKSQKSSTSSVLSTQLSSTSILAVASTKGSVFTTSAANYTPMGMYVNIRCPKNCYLWINFYSSSQNTGVSPPQGGHTNTFGLFLNESDQGIYSQASFPTDYSSAPISLNTTIPVSAGFYTIDMRAKTSGGILQSNVSSLQVMAIER